MLKIKKSDVGHKHPKIDDVEKVLKKETTKRLNVDIPKSFYLQIKNFAVEHDMSLTEMTKQALTEFIKNNKIE